jgi:predicted TIM-barrel fold metal-dependent hydrolase
MQNSPLANPRLEGISSAKLRVPQPAGSRKLPADFRIASADGHFETVGDVYYERFPDRLKDKAPRYNSFHGMPIYSEPGVEISAASVVGPSEQDFQDYVTFAVTSGVGEGAWDMTRRIHDLDAEGVRKELLFPQTIVGTIRNPDREVQEHVFRIYNELLAETCRRYPGRLYGVGICSNWWDPTKAHDAIGQIVELGLSTYMIPALNPGKTLDGVPITFGAAEMDAFWSEAEDAGLPVSFHVGENLAIGPRSTGPASILVSFDPFRKPVGEIMFGGVLDRHPNLRLFFAEGGLSWVPHMLQHAEGILDYHRTTFNYLPERRPSEYWRDNCYASFMYDPLGLRQLDYIGVENALWASDYPHNESTVGYGWDTMFDVIDAVGEDAARKILGETCISLFHMDDDLGDHTTHDARRLAAPRLV